MSDSPKDLFVSSAIEQWKAVVRLACSGTDPEALAKETSTNSAVMKRKFAAIRFKRESGWDEQAIIAAGQGSTLSSYARSKKNGHEPERMLRWRVPRHLADAVMSAETSEDQEEALVSRLVRVCKLRTSEDLWEFLLSVFADLTDDQIRNLAGVEKEKKRDRGRP